MKENIIKFCDLLLKPLQNAMSKSVINANIETFENASLSYKIRGFIHPLLRKLIKIFLGRKMIVDKNSTIQFKNSKLDPNKQYIYVSTHLFGKDINSALAIIDKNAYLLAGTKDQIETNPQMLIAWANGLIYVDRNDKQSKKDSLEKMKVVIKKGKSVLIYPEGYLNNSENLILQEFFKGVHDLSCATGLEVVPISSYNNFGSKDLHVVCGEPIELYKYSLKEGLIHLRDNLATMKWKQIENYSEPLKREELNRRKDYRKDFLEERRQIYLENKWTSSEALQSEIGYFKNKKEPKPKELWETFRNVKIKRENAYIMAPIMKTIAENDEYDLKNHIKKLGLKKQ